MKTMRPNTITTQLTVRYNAFRKTTLVAQWRYSKALKVIAPSHHPDDVWGSVCTGRDCQGTSAHGLPRGDNIPPSCMSVSWRM